MQEFDEAQLKKAVERLNDELSTLSRKPSAFTHRLKKRFHILQRIYLALLRQRLREKVGKLIFIVCLTILYK